jgi:putative transposase
MISIPRYNFPPRTEIVLARRPVIFVGQTEHGYEVMDSENGAVSIVPYSTFVEMLRLPGCAINTTPSTTGSRLETRLGGYKAWQALPSRQREIGEIRLALCRAMVEWRSKLRNDAGDPRLQLSGRGLDKPEAQEFIAEHASIALRIKIRTSTRAGGRSDAFILYKGRTLNELFRQFEALEPNESPVAALMPRHHLKGDRREKIAHRVRVLMTEAWERKGIDLRKPSVANVFSYFETRLRDENANRARNDLEPLRIPSLGTLKNHIQMFLTPTELLIGQTGRQHTRNKRGRGSTDHRALLIGELVEIDECKLSLVISAKEAGVWATLAENEKASLEGLDQYIKDRFWILVMIDVASRMPLAWVISETPSAESTLALLRMATRDKTLEKRLYRCSGEPASAVGLMHVKNDNGPGLRNTTAIGAMMQLGTTNTIGRTFEATDKSYVERLFGTLQGQVLQMLPGYTGSGPGDLPGYDALANGVITKEQLYGIVTRYFIDEYPSTRHYGADMFGRRPREVYEFINRTRGQIAPGDPNQRRLSLGWKEKVTPTDEGVRVFGGIWFNADEFQAARDGYKGKIQVFVDPDDLNFATAVVPGVQSSIELQLQTTAFADMTLPGVLNLMAEMRREDPAAIEFHQDQVMRCRKDRYELTNALEVEHNRECA